jgi:hypothetical protein
MTLEHLQEFAKLTCYPLFFGKTREITPPTVWQMTWQILAT